MTLFQGIMYFVSTEHSVHPFVKRHRKLKNYKHIEIGLTELDYSGENERDEERGPGKERA